MTTTRKNAGIRCPGHNYRARCIYHIVLNKADGIPAFSRITGSADSPCVVPSETGKTIDKVLSGLKHTFPHISILRKCIMPDHVHFAIFVRETTDIHLGLIIKALKNECFRGKSLFIDGYHDSFLTSRNQLPRMLAYISDNPRRHLLRQLNPGFFTRNFITDGAQTFETFGNIDLIDEPQLEAVRISRSFTSDVLIAKKRRWLLTVRNDGILVSPFISESERKVRDWAMRNGGAVIVLTDKIFPERYKPSGAFFDLCAQGRLLEISVPTEKLTRQACLRLNTLAEQIVSGKYKRTLT